MAYTVGSVPYLNAKPLVKPFEWAGKDSPVSVRYDVPSKLPKLLLDDQVQAILVSSIYALTQPGLRVADGVSISTQNEVVSVRLFSKTPLKEIKSVAFDASSMTSNALARIILYEKYGVFPEGDVRQPDIKSMLKSFDACVMIGDPGMGADDTGLDVLDLGAEWKSLTGLPFVWAVWAGDEALTPELVGHLQGALAEGRRRMDRVVDVAAEETEFSHDRCEHYLTQIMDYDFGPKHFEALKEFGRRLAKLEVIGKACTPEVVYAPEPLSRR